MILIFYNKYIINITVFLVLLLGEFLCFILTRKNNGNLITLFFSIIHKISQNQVKTRFLCPVFCLRVVNEGNLWSFWAHQTFTNIWCFPNFKIGIIFFFIGLVNFIYVFVIIILYGCIFLIFNFKLSL